MPKPLYNAELFRKYLAANSGLPCIVMGFVFLVVGVFVFFLATRVAFFVFLFALGGLLIVFGFIMLMFRCFCPQVIPDRKTVEGIFCRCIP